MSITRWGSKTIGGTQHVFRMYRREIRPDTYEFTAECLHSEAIAQFEYGPTLDRDEGNAAIDAHLAGRFDLWKSEREES